MNFKKKDWQTHKFYSSIVEKIRTNEDLNKNQSDVRIKKPSIYQKIKVKMSNGFKKLGCVWSKVKLPKKKKRKISIDLDEEFEYRPPPKPPKDI